MVAWRYKISLLVLKKIFYSFAALTRERFSQHSKRNFISPGGHVISSLYYVFSSFRQRFSQERIFYAWHNRNVQNRKIYEKLVVSSR